MRFSGQSRRVAIQNGRGRRKRMEWDAGMEWAEGRIESLLVQVEGSVDVSVD